MTTNRASKLFLFLLVFPLLGPLATACGSTTTCGTGTVERDGVCVPKIGQCFGAVTRDGTCVQPCGDGQTWDSASEQCVPSPVCGPGTVDQGGACVSACAADEHWDGTACAPGAACAPGTVIGADGTCVPAPGSCGPGTHLEGADCVPDATSCGAGTHLEDGRCVPDRLPAPDVPESQTGTADFTLPAAGAAVTLGGNVDPPDASGNADWDLFGVTVPAGTWLRLSATADGAALPAFVVSSEATDADGYPLYVRYALNPNGRDCAREVYLPRAGRYVVAVSDYANLAAELFGILTLPVGGADYNYQVRVENLGAPSPTTLGPFPATVTGDEADGALRFFRLAGLALDDAFDVASGAPGGAANDLFRAVLIFDPAGTLLRERVSGTTTDAARTIFAALAAGDYLVVVDHLVAIGPRVGFELTAATLTATDCGAVDCSSGALAAGGRALLRWDLAANDLFTGSVVLPTGATGSVRVVYLDRGLAAVTASTTATATSNAAYRRFATQATRVHALVINDATTAVPAYQVDARTLATPALPTGQLDTGLVVAGAPAGTWPAAGYGRALATAGQLLVTRSFAPTSGTWTTPIEEWLTTDLATAGPALDLVTVTSPLTVIGPLVAWAPAGGTLLHRASDAAGDVTGDTYQVAPYALDPTDLGTLPAAGTISATALTLDAGAAVAALRYAAAASQGAQVTVTPAGGATLRPDVWVLVPGDLQSGGGSTWVPAATGPRLAGMAHGTAAAAGAAVVVTFTSPYAGPCLLLVADAGGGAPADAFDVSVLQTP